MRRFSDFRKSFFAARIVGTVLKIFSPRTETEGFEKSVI